MRMMLPRSVKLAVLGAFLSLGVTGARADSFSMQLIADNDFAVFGGTADSITSLIYQNNYSWPDQLDNLASFSFDLQPGQTTFYLLGMGGGGNENLSGTINGVDITSLSTYNPDTDSLTYLISQSSDLSPYLTGYHDDGEAAVGSGTYDASLADVQAALSHLTWGDPTPTTEADDVAGRSPNGQGFHFDPDTASLFRFDSSAVGVAPVPEPSTWALMAGGSLLLAKFGFRRRTVRLK